ncbi:MAG: hypothetical protein FJ027_06960 [Candidatus Rokubacteria bacterium]|nr:hypothetical protein [Candidatus Rokubacteria bacterium]
MAGDGAGSGQEPIKDSPTQVLTLNEYKVFLRDQVRRSVLRWLAGIFGAIGIAGLVAIFAVGGQLVAIQLEDKVKPIADGLEARQEARLNYSLRLVTEPLHKIIADLRGSIDTAVRAEVSQSLLVRTGLYKQLQDTAGAIVKTKESEIADKASLAVQQAVNREVTPDKLRQTVSKSVEAEIGRVGFDRVMVERLRPVLDGRQTATEGQKEQALRLLSVFSADDQELRETLIRFMSNASEPKTLRLVAVETYRPAGDPAQNARALAAALAMVASATWDRAEMEHLTRFATAFAVDHATDMVNAAQRTVDDDVRTVVTQALGRSNTDEGAMALLRLAETPGASARQPDGRRTALLRLSAWRGLAAMSADRRWKSDLTRASALARAWDLLPEVVNDHTAEAQQRGVDPRRAPADSPVPTGTMPDARRALELLQGRGEQDDAFRDLLRSSEFGRRLDRPETLAVLPAASAGVSNLLRDDDLETTLRWIRRGGPATPVVDVVVDAWRRRFQQSHATSPEGRARFIQLGRALIDAPDVFYREAPTAALQWIVQAKVHEVTLDVVRRFPELYSTETARRFMGTALLAECLSEAQAPAVRGAVVELVRTFGAHPTRYAAFAPTLRLAADRQRETAPAESIALYDVAMKMAPRNVGALIGRSIALMRVRRFSDAAADLTGAIQAGALIDRPLALQFVRDGDERLATMAVEKSVEYERDDELKAGALENLGLYYVRARDYQKAFSLTDRVRTTYPGVQLPWNDLVRAIAARHLGKTDEERAAIESWNRLKSPADERAMNTYIGEAVREYFAR